VNNLAGNYHAQGKYAKAVPLYERTLIIYEKTLGPDHPHLAVICENYGNCYRGLGKEDEAEILETRAKTIRSKQ